VARRSPDYPDAAEFLTPARLRLTAAARRLVDAVLTATSSEAELDAAAEAMDRLVDELERSATTAPVREQPRERRHGDYLPRSPLVGELNAVAPPFEWTFEDGRLRAHGVFGAAHEGPPGYVHGGWVALAFDEALGIANVAAGNPGMTARLTVRYRRPTPLHVDVILEAWTERVEGRRVHTVGTMTAGDTITAEADGLFVNIGAERALEYFGERPATPEPTDPLP
jgi:acyl-coenzyme A thioesterase PaaI-like protein